MNRLFSRYCRRCGKILPISKGAAGLPGQREFDGQFADDWCFQHAHAGNAHSDATGLGKPDANQSPHQEGVPKVTHVLDLSTLERDGFRPPRVLLEMSFADGLLALHQGAGTLALVNPFGDQQQASQVPVVSWSIAEADVFSPPKVGDTGAGYSDNADLFRPFTPCMSRNRRHVIFSTPYACLAVDLWSIPGWTTGMSPAAHRRIFACQDDGAPRLAAAPVPLGDDDEIGLLFRTAEGRYHWSVARLNQAAERSSSNSTSSPSVKSINANRLEDVVPEPMLKLPISGNRCQIGVIEGSLITFATPCEQWIWSCDAARRSDLHILQRTCKAQGHDDDFRLDKHVENRSGFPYPQQVVLHEIDKSSGRPQLLDWFYLTRDDSSLEMYRLSFPNGIPTQPRPSLNCPKAEPLGCRLHDGQPVMLFRRADRFFQRGYGQDDLQSIGDLHLESGQVLGFKYEEPLLMTVSIDDSAAEAYRIDLLSVSSSLSSLRAYPTKPAAESSVRDPGASSRPTEIKMGSGSAGQPGGSREYQDPRRLTIAGVHLISMPLAWSRWLFTCEREGQETYLIRRELPVRAMSVPMESANG